MQTLIHADIFFFISTIALVIISMGVAIGLVFIILILKNLYKLTMTIRIEAGHIVEDIEELRAKVHGFSWSIAFALFKNLFIRTNK